MIQCTQRACLLQQLTIPPSVFLFLVCFEAGSHVELLLALISQWACLRVLRADMSGLGHHSRHCLVSELKTPWCRGAHQELQLTGA